ncbi:uncharacterized protein LOC126899713 [Daktulosphaira vitifoliae]|uniref:uncharacterized protein LOC126899713 n=1 Tax=Daktulosphaira vitifoliae TaxID=58002 RepID=UPI0021AA9498|nr:uncharacterized protein LOC126899713 [Daktulosphaira vitifoliae]XP_050530778.1 uncharacterized protein LOC126899713 [Daktulosphaira vitifoliae]
MAKKRRGAVGRPRKPNSGNKSGSRLSSVSKRVVNSVHKKSQSRKSISSNKLVSNNNSTTSKFDQAVLPTVVQLCSDDPVVTTSNNGNNTISKSGNCSGGSSEKTTVCQPPIAKTTSQLLRNMLLSTDRLRAKSATSSSSIGLPSNTSSSVPASTLVNNPPYYYDYYQQYENGPLNLEVMTPRKSSRGKCWNSRKSNANSVSLSKSPANVNRGNFYTPADLHAFPDIPQLADVDVAASLRGERDCILNDQISADEEDITSNTHMSCVDDHDVESSATEDTLSNQSTTDSEHRDFDQRWATMMSSSTARSVFDENSGGVGDTGIMMTPSCCGDTSTLDSDDRLIVDESLFLNNDLMHIQNYISDTVDAANEDAIIPLPDTTDVICTLQYYESRLLADHHLQNINAENLSTVVNANENGQQYHHHTLAEFANMLPCPVAGCLWYSHSATLYVHLFTCHQEMISYGSTITHAFRRQDVRDYCFYTHLQYVQNTVYIVTVAYDCYSRTFVATIQHVSSYGDNTSASSTTATLIAGGINNIPPSGLNYNNTRQQQNHCEQQGHSWTGHVQPYTVPLDVLHADGRCLFIDPAPSAVVDHIIVGVHLSNSVMPYDPETISTSSMLACL